jgi:hypothetical protein
MLLNPSKTEAVLFGSLTQHKKTDTSAYIDVAGIKVAISSTVKLLGVTLDEDLSVGLLQQPAVWNFHSKYGTFAGCTEITHSGCVSGNVVSKHQRTVKIT